MEDVAGDSRAEDPFENGEERETGPLATDERAGPAVVGWGEDTEIDKGEDRPRWRERERNK